MKKIVLVCTCICVVILIVAVCMLNIGNKNEVNVDSKSSLEINGFDDMSKLMDSIYAKANIDTMNIESRELDITDPDSVQAYLGLDSSDDLDTVLISENMISARAFTVALVKVKDESKVDAIKEKMVNNVDLRRLICVCSDLAWANNTGDVIILVTTDTETTEDVKKGFNEVANGNVGKEYSKELEELVF